MNKINIMNEITNQIIDHTSKFINEEVVSNDISIEYGTLIPKLYTEIKKVLQLEENEKIILLKGQEIILKKGKKHNIFNDGAPSKFFSELLVVSDHSKICYISGFWDFCINKQQKTMEQIIPIIYFNENMKLSEFMVRMIQLFDDVVFKSSKNPWLYEQKIIKPHTILFYLTTHIQRMIRLNKLYNDSTFKN